MANLNKSVFCGYFSASNHSNGRSNGSRRGNDEVSSENCAICLENITNRSLTDPCLHAFCFDCICQWSRQSHKCPICRTRYCNIFHNIRSDENFELFRVSGIQGIRSQNNNRQNRNLRNLVLVQDLRNRILEIQRNGRIQTQSIQNTIRRLNRDNSQRVRALRNNTTRTIQELNRTNRWRVQYERNRIREMHRRNRIEIQNIRNQIREYNRR